ncbi:NUDIX domain-containing protein [Herbiconiux sp. VKM Ac-2851]|uniref:NUDIX hydrolase n=1 Tax=Herbiconiux sp. VKM Ac-2851 TaxID=2739025 RepID=UPI001565786C|nr:NUDIX domain-containing protein [Herbiconiux sp. VKM Ac-2851]NQX33428.1 NUDIX domain-containing protein [Herbiconiux sp. VKM Ac-2851]
MTALPPTHPRDSGDAWVEGPDGRRFWGRYGAAGLLVHDETAGILLQHRAEWSHFGGTWGLPGGARHEGESAVDGAIREAEEEAGVPADALRLAFTSVLDLGYWSYVTVVTRTARFFDPRIGDAESLELRWVPLDEVESLPLHPGFGSAWPALRERLGERIRVVVDAANVVGSVPDGWWKDRAGAAARLISRLELLGDAGIATSEFSPEAGAGRSWPQFRVVLEGQAKDAAGAPSGQVSLLRAAGSGDDAIVDEVARAAALPVPGRIVVVTADRGLSERVLALGAEVRGPGWLRGLLDAVE